MPYLTKTDRAEWKRAHRRGERYSNHKRRGPQPHSAYRDIFAAIKTEKSKPCTDCRRNYPYYVMDLDHVRGERLFWLSDVTRRVSQFTLEEVLAELEKCDPVCANCHRERTHRKGYI